MSTTIKDMSKSLINLERKHLSKCCNVPITEEDGFAWCTKCWVELYALLVPSAWTGFPYRKLPRVTSYTKKFRKLFGQEMEIVGQNIMRHFDESHQTLLKLGLVSKHYPLMNDIMYVILGICEMDDLQKLLEKPKTSLDEINYILNFSPNDNAYIPLKNNIKIFGSCLSVQNASDVMKTKKPESSMEICKRLMKIIGNKQ